MLFFFAPRHPHAPPREPTPGSWMGAPKLPALATLVLDGIPASDGAKAAVYEARANLKSFEYDNEDEDEDEWSEDEWIDEEGEDESDEDEGSY